MPRLVFLQIELASWQMLEPSIHALPTNVPTNHNDVVETSAQEPTWIMLIEIAIGDVHQMLIIMLQA
jgi:hypothetical protein